MDTLMFDTHKAVKALKEAGFDDSQAEAVAATVGDAIGENVATKDDIVAVKADIETVKADIVAVKADIETVKADIVAVKGDIETVKADIVAVKGDIGELRTDFSGLRTEFAGLRIEFAEFKAEIYRHLWLMAAGIVGLTVTLVKLIP